MMIEMLHVKMQKVTFALLIVVCPKQLLNIERPYASHVVSHDRKHIAHKVGVIRGCNDIFLLAHRKERIICFQ